MTQDPPDSDAVLKQLVYASQATVAPDADGLRRLLADAQSRNRRANITGVLFHFDGRFLQCLEGPARAVDETMARIRADRRHHDLAVLIEQPARARLFADWDMGHAPLTAAGWQRLASANWPPVAPLGQGGAEGLAVLRALARP